MSRLLGGVLGRAAGGLIFLGAGVSIAEACLYNGASFNRHNRVFDVRWCCCECACCADSVALSACLPAVDAGHRALIFDRFAGVKPQVIPEGTHVRVPWLQKPIIMDVRTRPRIISTQTGTKGTQHK